MKTIETKKINDNKSYEVAMETSCMTVISSVSRFFLQTRLTMATLNIYREKLRFLSKTEVMERRLDLFNVINGDAFFPLQVCPQDMKRIFWSRAMWKPSNSCYLP